MPDPLCLLKALISCLTAKYFHLTQIWFKICFFRSRLAEESDRNEKLIAKEKLINLYLSAAVAERVDAQSNKLAMAHSDEVIQIYNSNSKKIQSVSKI